MLFYDLEASAFTAVEKHGGTLITDFCPQRASVYVDCVCVDSSCNPETKQKHALSYIFPLRQTSVSLENAGNPRAMTSPLELEK